MRIYRENNILYFESKILHKIITYGTPIAMVTVGILSGIMAGKLALEHSPDYLNDKYRAKTIEIQALSDRNRDGILQPEEIELQNQMMRCPNRGSRRPTMEELDEGVNGFKALDEVVE